MESNNSYLVQLLNSDGSRKTNNQLIQELIARGGQGGGLTQEDRDLLNNAASKQYVDDSIQNLIDNIWDIINGVQKQS